MHNISTFTINFPKNGGFSTKLHISGQKCANKKFSNNFPKIQHGQLPTALLPQCQSCRHSYWVTSLFDLLLLSQFNELTQPKSEVISPTIKYLQWDDVSISHECSQVKPNKRLHKQHNHRPAWNKCVKAPHPYLVAVLTYPTSDIRLA